MEFAEVTGIDALVMVILTLLVALRVGSGVFSRLTCGDSHDPLESLYFSVGLGLGVISLATFLLGAAGLLYRPVFQVAFASGLVISVPGLVRAFRPLGRQTRPRVSSWFVYPVVGFLAGVAFVCLLAALAPETGFDALNYHLGIPRLYIANHRIVETVNLAGYSHPLAVDMVYVFAWLIKSSLAAKLIHFAFGLLTAAGCWVFCRRYAVSGSGSLAALLFLSSPIVMYLSQTAYVDLGLAFFALLAVFAAFRWLESGHRYWLLLAGVYSGLSLGAKYMGAAVVVVILALVVLAAIRQRRLVLLDLFMYCGMAALVFAPWLIKNWVTSGNPFAPALSNIIPTEGFASPDYDRLVQLTRSWHGYPGNLFDWIATPWRQTFRTDIFHGSPGLVYLFLLPVAFALSWRDRWLRLLTVCVAVGYLFLLLGTATTRFFVLVFPWISILIAAVLWPRGRLGWNMWARRLLVVLALVLMAIKLPWFPPLFGIPEPLILDTDKVQVFRSAEERERFLEAKILGTGGNELYQFFRGLPQETRILALTPVYQALTDHEVFLPPNSTPSSEMAAAAIDVAKDAMGLKDVELSLLRPDMTGRFWKIRLNSSGSLTPDETRPRLFYLENGVPMEIAVYGVTVLPPQKGAQEVLLDLGAPCRVERVTLLSRESGASADYDVFVSPGWSKGRWEEIQTRVTVNQSGSSSERLLRLLTENGITHVVIGHHTGAAFLPEFYVKRQGLAELAPVKSFGNYEVLEVKR